MGIPHACEVRAEALDGRPLLGVTIRVDVPTIANLLGEVRPRLGEEREVPNGLEACPIEAPLRDAVIRLLESLQSPVDAAILGPNLMREITYRVLCGQQGNVLRSLLVVRGRSARIHAAMQRIARTYASPLDVSSLASEAGMSVSAFHHDFKVVAATSPMQYLKSVRLHQARLFMLQDGLGVAAAAERVGYLSASQFSREFKRLFGRTPTDFVNDAFALDV